MKNYNWLSTTVVKGSSSISKLFDIFFSGSWRCPRGGWIDVEGEEEEEEGFSFDKTEETNTSWFSFTIF